jgi:hypothetical protein
MRNKIPEGNPTETKLHELSMDELDAVSGGSVEVRELVVKAVVVQPPPPPPPTPPVKPTPLPTINIRF